MMVLFLYREKTVDPTIKISFVLNTFLVRTLNARPTYLFSNTWGYWDAATNRINGMLGDLIDRKAHMGGSPAFLLTDRVSKFEFVSVSTPTDAYFTFRPPPLSNVANIYYLPFNGTVWIGSGAIILVSCLIIYISIKRKEDANDERTRFSDIILLAIAAVCQMGSDVNTRHLSSKISTVSMTSLRRCIFKRVCSFSFSCFSCSCSHRIRLILFRCCKQQRKVFERWKICTIQSLNMASRTHRTIGSISNKRPVRFRKKFIRKKLRLQMKSRIS